MDQIIRLGIKRFLIVLVVAAVLTLAGNEILYRLQKESYDRPPGQVELVIPSGTSERVAAGEQAPSIPEEMVFVVGDVLVVNNEDVESHNLGPLWIPSGASASINLDQPMRYTYNCSFQASNYMGLDVRTPTTLGTRLQGLILAGPATVIFLFLYSLLVYPIQTTNDKAKEQKSESYTRESPPPQE